MTQPAAEQPKGRLGCLILVIGLAVVAAAIVVATKLWPDSMQERQDQAVDACKSAVDEKAPTEWRKLWQEDSINATGDDPVTVTGKFSTKTTDFQSFTCTVQDGKVTDTEVSS